MTLIQRRSERLTVAASLGWDVWKRDGWKRMEEKCLRMIETEKEEVKVQF